MKESELQKSILEWLDVNKNIGYFWRTNPTGIGNGFRVIQRGAGRIKGVSDIIGVLKNGKLCAIEVKIKGGTISPEQVAFMKNVNSRGGLAFIARSLDDVINVLGGE